jgi:hypothetical protein
LPAPPGDPPPMRGPTPSPRPELPAAHLPRPAPADLPRSGARYPPGMSPRRTGTPLAAGPYTPAATPHRAVDRWTTPPVPHLSVCPPPQRRPGPAPDAGNDPPAPPDGPRPATGLHPRPAQPWPPVPTKTPTTAHRLRGLGPLPWVSPPAPALPCGQPAGPFAGRAPAASPSPGHPSPLRPTTVTAPRPTPAPLARPLSAHARHPVLGRKARAATPGFGA